MGKTVLIVASSKQILDILSFAIGREGYIIVRSSNEEECLEMAVEHEPNIVVMDLGSPTDNESACSSLRDVGAAVPIIVLTAADDANQIGYLEGFACIGLRKPFAMRELLLQISEILRFEGASSDGGADESLQRHLGRLVVDLGQMRVTKDGDGLELTKLEFDILNLLSSEPGRVFSREELLNRIWNYTGYLGDMRSVDVAVRRLREKVEDNPARPKMILTRRGRGYLFVEQ